MSWTELFLEAIEYYLLDPPYLSSGTTLDAMAEESTIFEYYSLKTATDSALVEGPFFFVA